MSILRNDAFAHFFAFAQSFSGRKGNFGEIINVSTAPDVKSTNTDR